MRLWLSQLTICQIKRERRCFTIGCELTQIPQQKSDIAIKARLDKDVYKIGDELQLEVKPSADAYITIIKIRVIPLALAMGI